MGQDFGIHSERQVIVSVRDQRNWTEMTGPLDGTPHAPNMM